MAKQLVLPEEELARKAGIIKILSLGFLAGAVFGEIITVIICKQKTWVLNLFAAGYRGYVKIHRQRTSIFWQGAKTVHP